jgi:hypothetical protein
VRPPIIFAFAVIAAATLVTGCGGSSKRANPRLLVPWTSVGDISLGEPITQLKAEGGLHGTGGVWIVHGGTPRAVEVTSDLTIHHRDTVGLTGRVNEIDFHTPYYRTRGGLGVGSAFPRRWRTSFLYSPGTKKSGGACGCWVKLGTGQRSLPWSLTNFGKQPKLIITVVHGRIVDILLTTKIAISG